MCACCFPLGQLLHAELLWRLQRPILALPPLSSAFAIYRSTTYLALIMWCGQINGDTKTKLNKLSAQQTSKKTTTRPTKATALTTQTLLETSIKVQEAVESCQVVEWNHHTSLRAKDVAQQKINTRVLPYCNTVHSYMAVIA
ncbi:hypothetical protein THAOC_34924 [Thalassiosira oceanica]|uniref:Uncharacterized protein n=1 Tax=Thalassiosira oceanica TaxID=159749 RepID=K0R462_THAOC|nr:hypothetical protein THAOC_34924 [Thalassiosira oceanica]|eukprot:EJK46409.1 hypothetical protein THAOC_34924 [Thalassiosira oceanica]